MPSLIDSSNNKIKIDSKVGSGAFGTIYKGYLVKEKKNIEVEEEIAIKLVSR